MSYHLIGLVDDPATRDRIATYQFQMERLVINLLSKNRNIALTQIEEARKRALDYVKKLGNESFSIEQEAQSTRLAVVMLEKSFRFIQEVIETPDEEESPKGESE
jgi:hypothetical protein